MRVRRLKRLRSTAFPVRRGAWTRSEGIAKRVVAGVWIRQALTSSVCGAPGALGTACAVNDRAAAGAGSTWSEWRTTRKRRATWVTWARCVSRMSPAGARLKREDVAALRSAALQHHAAVLRLHAGEESVGLRTASVVWLKSALHNPPSWLTAQTGPQANLRVYWETRRFSMNFSLALGRCYSIHAALSFSLACRGRPIASRWAGRAFLSVSHGVQPARVLVGSPLLGAAGAPFVRQLSRVGRTLRPPAP